MKILPDPIEIKTLRKRLKITQKQLGQKLKIPQSTISRIESGLIDPPYSKLKKIFEFLENERMQRERSKKHAEDIMTPNIIFVNPKSTIKETIDLMNYHGISQLPILNHKQNLGSITSKRIQYELLDNPSIINMDVSLIKELPFPEVDRTWNAKDISNLLINYPAVLVKDSQYNFIGIITHADFLKLTESKKS
jgi:predicted transcriptional regulator